MATVHREMISDNPAFDVEMDALRASLRAETDEIDPAWWQDLDRDSQPDCSSVLPLWDWLSDQSSWYHMTGTSQGAWLAEQLTEWAALARSLGTETAEAFASKVRQLEAMTEAPR